MFVGARSSPSPSPSACASFEYLRNSVEENRGFWMCHLFVSTQFILLSPSVFLTMVSLFRNLSGLFFRWSLVSYYFHDKLEAMSSLKWLGCDFNLFNRREIFILFPTRFWVCSALVCDLQLNVTGSLSILQGFPALCLCQVKELDWLIL